jgi:hypothetical protein
MKRVRPLHQRTDTPGYPSVIQHTLEESVHPDAEDAEDDEDDGALGAEAATPSPPSNRRRFLQGAAAAGAALAGGLLPGRASTAKSRSPRRGKPHRVTLPHTKGYTFRYGNYQLQRAVAQTRDDALVRFLSDSKEQKGIERTIRKVLDRHTCADITDAKRLARLRRAVARALVARYRVRTRKRARLPTVVLFVGVPPARCKGDCPAAVPICRPPTP